MDYMLFVAGLTILVAGAEFLVRGASKLAGAAGISPLIIGLTVVAYGTSAPEVAVSVKAGLAGQGEIALGNIIGSNIFNVLFILGVAALISPLVVSIQLIRIDVPVMIFVSLAALALALDGGFGRFEGMVLMAALMVYTAFPFRLSRKADAGSPGDIPSGEKGRLVGSAIWGLAGLALLAWGANWFVQGASAIASGWGVSDFIIGVTIVACGTSLPELATSVIASIRGQTDMAVGNIVGSNIFNLLGVLGLTAMTAPAGIPVSNAVLGFDFPVMVAVAVACLPVFFTGFRITRLEGAIFLGCYGAYAAFLIAASSWHDAQPAFNVVTLSFVIPLLLLTLVVIVRQALRPL